MFHFPLLLIAAGLPGLQSVPGDTISAARVSAEKALIVSSRDTVSINGRSADELLLSLPGLQVNDYGSLSGVKTVGFRGLGSSNTTVSIDGIRMVNIQSGQNDLGMIAAEDFSEAVLDYATNTVNFNTLRPVYSGWRAYAKGGMFNTFEGHGDLERVFKNDLALKASATGTFSKGDFPYGDGLHREGNDIARVHAGLDFFMPRAHVKAYCNFSDRGTPGPTTWPSADRQKDGNAFLQGTWSACFGRIYRISASGKVSYDRLAYNTAYGSNLYEQTAALAKVTNDFRINAWLSAQANLDLEGDHMAGDLKGSRISARPEAVLNVSLPHFMASADLMWQSTKDKNNKALEAVSPALQLKWMPSGWVDITAFGRRAYRVPTFNELYYVGFGNPNLRPEDAWLGDVGIAIRRTLGEFALRGGVDVFYNYLTNKIISAPTLDNPSIWLPDNIGIVSIPGFDLSAGAVWKHEDFKVGLSAKYAFMDASDQTKDSATKGQQIAYVPKHSANLTADIHWERTYAVLAWNLRAGRRDSYAAMPSWNTLDLTFSQGVGRHLKLALYCRNLTDARYEISSGYPMPGISVLGGVEICF